jgi:hypothetical protein
MTRQMVINVINCCDYDSAGSLNQLNLEERECNKMKDTKACRRCRHTESLSFNMRIRPFVVQSFEDVSRCSILNVPSPRLYFQYNEVTTGKRKTSRSDIRRLQRDRFGRTNRDYFFRHARDYYHRRSETDQTCAQNALRRHHIWSP